MAGRVVQKRRQLKEENGVDCAKVAASVYSSIQWRASDEYGKKWMAEGNDFPGLVLDLLTFRDLAH